MWAHLFYKIDELTLDRFLIPLCIPYSVFILFNEISEVSLTDKHIQIKYPSPFKKDSEVSLDEIVAYNEILEKMTFSKKTIRRSNYSKQRCTDIDLFSGYK